MKRVSTARGEGEERTGERRGRERKRERKGGERREASVVRVFRSRTKECHRNLTMQQISHRYLLGGGKPKVSCEREQEKNQGRDKKTEEDGQREKREGER